ncbi:MAG: very short patch repair endonuclease [Pseudomonadota bacterium]
MDVLTPAQRSFCMSRIKGRNTKPERALRAALWGLGLRYRIHHALLGRPDVVFPSQRVAIFIDGCFWHGCPEHGVQPKTNEAFWRSKIGRNRERDRKVTSTLQAEGWTVLRFWEHELKKDLPQVVEQIVRARGGAVDNGSIERSRTEE